MKSAKEMYPELEEPFYGPGSYGPLLESLGTIVVQVDDSDYSGDSRVLYRDGDEPRLHIRSLPKRLHSRPS